jgi:glucose/arabinose dehydrogenase
VAMARPSCAAYSYKLGVALIANQLFVAKSDAQFPYKPGQTHIKADDRKIFDLSALPTNGHNNHWTRNVIISRDGQNPYVSVSLATGVDGEHIDAKDSRRVAILEIIQMAQGCACSQAG